MPDEDTKHIAKDTIASRYIQIQPVSPWTVPDIQYFMGFRLTR